MKIILLLNIFYHSKNLVDKNNFRTDRSFQLFFYRFFSFHIFYRCYSDFRGPSRQHSSGGFHDFTYRLCYHSSSRNFQIQIGMRDLLRKRVSKATENRQWKILKRNSSRVLVPAQLSRNKIIRDIGLQEELVKWFTNFQNKGAYFRDEKNICDQLLSKGFSRLANHVLLKKLHRIFMYRSKLIKKPVYVTTVVS